MLDERQYRSDQACSKNELEGKGRPVALSACEEIKNVVDKRGRRREVLGREQEQWLGSELARSQATWNVLAQGVMMAHIDSRADCQFPTVKTEEYIWTDGWSGYLAARQRVVDLMDLHRAKNPDRAGRRYPFPLRQPRLEEPGGPAIGNGGAGVRVHLHLLQPAQPGAATRARQRQ